MTQQKDSFYFSYRRKLEAKFDENMEEVLIGVNGITECEGKGRKTSGSMQSTNKLSCYCLTHSHSTSLWLLPQRPTPPMSSSTNTPVPSIFGAHWTQLLISLTDIREARRFWIISFASWGFHCVKWDAGDVLLVCSGHAFVLCGLPRVHRCTQWHNLIND